MHQEAAARRRASRLWYAVPVTVAAVALGLAVSIIGSESDAVADRISSLDRVAAPGQSEISFDESGEYILYVEGPVTPSSYVDPTEIILLPDEPQSRQVELREFPTFLTYTDPSGIGARAAFEFDITEPGDYWLKVRRTPTDVDGIAIGDYIYADSNPPVRKAFGIAALGVLTAIGLTVLIAVVQRLSRRDTE